LCVTSFKLKTKINPIHINNVPEIRRHAAGIAHKQDGIIFRFNRKIGLMNVETPLTENSSTTAGNT